MERIDMISRNIRPAAYKTSWSYVMIVSTLDGCFCGQTSQIKKVNSIIECENRQMDRQTCCFIYIDIHI